MTTSRISGWASVLVLGALLTACGEDQPKGATAVDPSVEITVGGESTEVTVVDPADDPFLAASRVLNDDNYADYKAKIGPQPFDAAWQKIQWLPSYGSGLEAASRAKQPVLLWVMNGHPLGCT